MSRLIVAITGATGAILGVRLLETLSETRVETHLVTSTWGERTIEHETGRTFSEVRDLATTWYDSNDMGAAISSGSFLTDGMVVAPCSMRSLAAISNGGGNNLVHRAADVVLKERRRLVLVVRETPFNSFHLENMLKLSRSGVTIFPPVPAFYNHPRTLDDVIDHLVARVLDQFGIDTGLGRPWTGEMITPSQETAENSPLMEEGAH